MRKLKSLLLLLFPLLTTCACGSTSVTLAASPTATPIVTAKVAGVDFATWWVVTVQEQGKQRFAIDLTPDGSAFRLNTLDNQNRKIFCENMKTVNLSKDKSIWGKASTGACGSVNIAFFELTPGPPALAFYSEQTTYKVQFVADSPGYGSEFGDKFTGTFNDTWQYIVTAHPKNYPLQQ